MRSLHRLGRRLRSRRDRLAGAQVSPAEQLQQPCGDCPHVLRRHQAQEGMCRDCGCFGWVPISTATAA